ncbi:hypothetical protein M0802_013916 [Mischocyttarus mexicanus]|nr:hypothetical protein M0802_013916 [Mischocyttarus mexicanus]
MKVLMFFLNVESSCFWFLLINTMDATFALITQCNQILQKFDPEDMHLLVWLNSFEYVLESLDITDDKKVHFLLSRLENFVYILIREQVSPENPFDLPYDFIISKLEELFSPLKGTLAARYRFDCRNQYEGENVRHYAETLKKLNNRCNFGIKANVYLVIRFIIGLKSYLTKKKLLQTQKLSFDKAIYLAERMEFYKMRH